MRVLFLSIVSLCCAVTMLGLVGCSGSNGATEQVTGTVTFEDGTPIKGGTIVFASLDENSSSIGYIKEDGTYELGTFSETDGAPKGRYEVTVIGSSDYGQSSPIHQKYANQGQSPLKAEVQDGPNVIDFKVEKAR
ncbi:carboxypeptidase-like regulatory domain-containing protein [Bremerella cremea]|uniref:carboxypeptidase-like regulatory domain-containing protein n=1 Tax=Bremerella cremea TaxID=1031537 RepID=UPI0031ECDE30